MEEIDSDSDYIRKKYFYRSLIVKGGARVKNSKSTRRLIGPDCAYHLYSYMKKESLDAENSETETETETENNNSDDAGR